MKSLQFSPQLWQSGFMTLINKYQTNNYRQANTRLVTLPDGRSEKVYMSSDLWVQYEAMLSLDNLDEGDIVDIALKEKAAQHEANVRASFSECFRCVVTQRVIEWHDAHERVIREIS